MIQGSPERVARFKEAYSKGKLEMQDNSHAYILGYRYKGWLYVKIYETKQSRPDLREDNTWIRG